MNDWVLNPAVQTAIRLMCEDFYGFAKRVSSASKGWRAGNIYLASDLQLECGVSVNIRIYYSHKDPPRGKQIWIAISPKEDTERINSLAKIMLTVDATDPNHDGIRNLLSEGTPYYEKDPATGFYLTEGDLEKIFREISGLAVA